MCVPKTFKNTLSGLNQRTIGSSFFLRKQTPISIFHIDTVFFALPGGATLLNLYLLTFEGLQKAMKLMLS